MNRKDQAHWSKNIFRFLGKPLYWAVLRIGIILQSWGPFLVRMIFHLGLAVHKRLLNELQEDSLTFHITKQRTRQTLFKFFQNRTHRAIAQTSEHKNKKLKPSATSYDRSKPPVPMVYSLYLGLRRFFSIVLETVHVVQNSVESFRYQTAFRFRVFCLNTQLVLSSPILHHPVLKRFHRLWLPIAVFLLVFLTTTSSVLTVYTHFLATLPTAMDLKTHTPSLTTRIYDRNGVLLSSIYKDENRSLVKLSDLPPHLLDAFISIEDKEFYEHHGVSVKGLLRVARLFFLEPNKKLQGASTITQQLVKNTLLNRERSLHRKLKEMFIAIHVEREFSKEQILEMYLNEVSLGGSVYGVEEAAKAYFNKHAKDLSLSESAFLAGLLAAPSIYNPFGNTPELGMARYQEVLRRMHEDDEISALTYEETKNQKPIFVQTKRDLKAPHFVMFVREKLAKELGEDVVAQGGLEIYTTLDLSLQLKAQDIVTKEVESLKRLHIGNGAALITNPQTGEILAMVGSADYFESKNDGQVNVPTRPRQPGSSIKPLTYAAAFERGFTPATLIEDTPITISIHGSPPYTPKNYDGNFHGKVTVRRALASSYNIPAVKTLMNIGLPNLIEKARLLGISTWTDSRRYGLSLTLGGGEVLMTDMATAYSTFANRGTTVPLQFIKEIKDSTGKTIQHNPCIETSSPCGGKHTLDPRIAYQITSILSDNTARAPAFGTRSVLYIPGQEVAVKTGTTNSQRDNWTIGYTTNRLVATWVGNNDNTPMSRVTSGVIGASPIWAKIMKELLPEGTSHTFSVPEGLVSIKLCPATGLTSCGTCTTSYTEYFLPGTEPPSECSVIAKAPQESLRPQLTPSPTPRLRKNR